MTAEVTERTGEIRGVTVRWVNVVVTGHTVEQVLSFDVAEAEDMHGRPFDDEMDKHIQMSLSQKSELVMGMSLGVPSKRHQLGRC